MNNRQIGMFTLTALCPIIVFAQGYDVNDHNNHMAMMNTDGSMQTGFMSGGWLMIFWIGLLVLATIVITRWVTAPEKKLISTSFAVGGPMKKKQYLVSFLLLATTLALHLIISPKDLTLHILFRFLYLVPIAYVGLKAGKKGGVLTAVITSILYMPHFLFGTTSAEFQTGNIVAVLLFYITGFFTGLYRDASKKVYLSQLDETIDKPNTSSSKNILFYVDDKPLTQFTSEWFVNYFGGDPDINVTLLWISLENVEDIMESSEQVQEHLENLQITTREKLKILENTFINEGYPEKNINTKVIRLKNKTRLANVIQRELKSGLYDFVLIPKHKLSRSQEFLFGDTAIQLIRESGYPVLTVASEPSD